MFGHHTYKMSIMSKTELWVNIAGHHFAYGSRKINYKEVRGEGAKFNYTRKDLELGQDVTRNGHG
jgi:hypothetical protein